ncbi:unnamed protein product [Alternaria alternata]
MVFSIGTTVIVIMASQLYGWDRHVWDLTPHEMMVGIHGRSDIIRPCFFHGQDVYPRIVLSHRTRKVTVPQARLGNLALVFAAFVVFLVALWVQCIPISSYWELKADHRDCIPEGPPLVVQSVLNVVTDFMIYALPIPTLFTLCYHGLNASALSFFSVGGVIVVA